MTSGGDPQAPRHRRRVMHVAMATLTACLSGTAQATEHGVPLVHRVARVLRRGYESVREGFIFSWRRSRLTADHFAPTNDLSHRLMWRASSDSTSALSIVTYVKQGGPKAGAAAAEQRKLGVHAVLILGATQYELVGTEYAFRAGAFAVSNLRIPLGWCNVNIDTVQGLAKYERGGSRFCLLRWVGSQTAMCTYRRLGCA